jgi:hypothetical protein
MRQMPATHAETIAEALSFIDRALTRIEKGESAEAEAHNIRAYLVNTLELVERDSGIEAAADDLYAVVAAFVTGHQKPSMAPNDATGEFCAKRFCGSKPSLRRASQATKRRQWGWSDPRSVHRGGWAIFRSPARCSPSGALFLLGRPAIAAVLPVLGFDRFGRLFGRPKRDLRHPAGRIE